MTNQVYCNKRTDGFKLHELVEQINRNSGKLTYKCMWCNKVYDR